MREHWKMQSSKRTCKAVPSTFSFGVNPMLDRRSQEKHWELRIPSELPDNIGYDGILRTTWLGKSLFSECTPFILFERGRIPCYLGHVWSVQQSGKRSDYNITRRGSYSLFYDIQVSPKFTVVHWIVHWCVFSCVVLPAETSDSWCSRFLCLASVL